MSRKLGTHAFDKQTTKGLGIEVATVEMFNFGLLVESERGIDKVHEIFNMNDFTDKFGDFDQNYYGKYVMTSFFDQITTAPAKAYVKRFIASDADASTKTIQNGGAADALKLEAGYRGYLDPGTWGDNVGYEISHSNKTTTEVDTAAAQSDTEIEVLSVAGFEVGDAIKIDIGTPEYFTISAINEADRKLELSGAISDVGGAPQGTDILSVNFDLKIHKKNSNGLIEEVEEWLYLSMEDSVTNFVETVLNDQYKGSKYVYATDLNPGSSLSESLPAVTSAVTFLASGSNGTGPTNADWENELAEFDIYPVRLLANAENQTDTVNQDGEAYCRGRGNCLWIAAGDSDMTYDEGKAWGAKLMRSEQNYSTGDLQWFEVEDPVGLGDNPTIQIPAIGITAGYWFQTIYDRGFHKNPGGLTKSIAGVRDIVMDDQTEKDIMNDQKRTELADLGVNVFQYQKGRGFVRRTSRMFSSRKEFRYAASMFMKCIIKESVKLSVEEAEMEALGWEWLTEVKAAVRSYMMGLYQRSTNNGNESAFFIGFSGEGSPTSFNDVVTIVADDSNNTNSSLLDGEANIDVGFIPPAPAESIFIGVGINVLKKEV